MISSAFAARFQQRQQHAPTLILNTFPHSNRRFLHSNLAPNQDYFVYATMQSLGDRGAVKAKIVHAAGDGSLADAGDLIPGPSHRLSGKVICSDGKAIPAHTRVTVGREDAWDAQIIELDGDGRFSVGGLPEGEQISLSIRIAGYRLSDKNKSLDRLNHVSVGVDTGRLLTGSVSLFGPAYGGEAERKGFWDRALLRMAAVPGVELAALSDGRPPTSPGQHNNFDLEDHPATEGRGQPVCPWVAVSPGCKIVR